MMFWPWPLLCLGCALFILPTCVPSSTSVYPSSYRLSLKPGAPAAHQLAATEPPRASWGICSLRLLPDKWRVCLSLAERCFSEGQRGWLPVGVGGGGVDATQNFERTGSSESVSPLITIFIIPFLLYIKVYIGDGLPLCKAGRERVNGFSSLSNYPPFGVLLAKLCVLVDKRFHQNHHPHHQVEFQPWFQKTFSYFSACSCESPNLFVPAYSHKLRSNTQEFSEADLTDVDSQPPWRSDVSLNSADSLLMVPVSFWRVHRGIYLTEIRLGVWILHDLTAPTQCVWGVVW